MKWAEEAIALEPFRESGYRRLTIVTYAWSGLPALAASAARRLHLLGFDPSVRIVRHSE